MEEWKDGFEIAETFTAITAIIIGAIVSYIKFFRGRTNYTRLDPSLAGEIISGEKSDFLWLKVGLKNIGTTKATLKHKGMRVDLYLPESFGDSQMFDRVPWEHRETYGIFGKEESLESGEAIKEEYMIILPKDKYSLVRAVAVVKAGELSWKAEHIFQRAS